jgi:hypothetical protein
LIGWTAKLCGRMSDSDEPAPGGVGRKRKRGRPAGSKNKPKTTLEQLAPLLLLPSTCAALAARGIIVADTAARLHAPLAGAAGTLHAPRGGRKRPHHGADEVAGGGSGSSAADHDPAHLPADTSADVRVRARDCWAGSSIIRQKGGGRDKGKGQGMMLLP